MSESENLEAQLEEITVISSIYGDDFVTINEDFGTHSLRVTDGCEPPRLFLNLEITFLNSYPSDSPPLYAIGADWVTNEVEDTISSKLESLYERTCPVECAQ
eukprot:scpid52430/ scgid18571/ Protein IMPACT-A; Imprinted and ancient gene protein homolog A